jgi:hypothetical protein
MKRVVEPELLDELPKENLRAIHSRRDLQRINFFMGNAVLAERRLRGLFPESPPKRIAELGAGDGTFMLKIAQKFSRDWKNVEIILVDHQELVSPETREKFRRLGCNLKTISADVFHWLSNCEPVDCIFANLFLHHFEDKKLSELFHLVSMKTTKVFGIEPHRSRGGIFGTKLLWLIGCNDVTRHDAAISVRAGFASNELSALWPEKSWQLEESDEGLFSHGFLARANAK